MDIQHVRAEVICATFRIIFPMFFTLSHIIAAVSYIFWFISRI